MIETGALPPSNHIMIKGIDMINTTMVTRQHIIIKAKNNGSLFITFRVFQKCLKSEKQYRKCL